jgi:large subunit ribosomal protein L25
MDQKTFTAVERTKLGKGPVGRLRKDGKVPAVIYGRKGTSVSVSLEEKEVLKTLHEISESTIVKVKVGGKEIDAFVKDTQMDYLANKLLHVDFYEVEKDRVLRAKVPLKMVGSPAGVREGGVFEIATHEIEVECLPANLPERIEVDVSNLNLNQTIHVRDLKLAASVKVHTSADQVVAAVKYAKEEKVAPVVEAIAGGTAEAAEAAAATDAAPVEAPAKEKGGKEKKD